MTELVYFVAASRDGFIAGPNGELDWLHAYESADEDYGYNDFIAGVDDLVMGRSTFDVTLGFGAWPYGERPAWVLTHREPPPNAPPHLRFGAFEPQALCGEWQRLDLKRVWLVGGGEVASQFAPWIDEVILSTIPVTLGQGRPLFAPPVDGLAGLHETSRREWPTGLVQRRLRRQR